MEAFKDPQTLNSLPRRCDCNQDDFAFQTILDLLLSNLQSTFQSNLDQMTPFKILDNELAILHE